MSAWLTADQITQNRITRARNRYDFAVQELCAASQELESALSEDKSVHPPVLPPERAPDPRFTHGSNSSYHNHYCRCRACKAAHAAYQRGLRARKAAAK